MKKPTKADKKAPKPAKSEKGDEAKMRGRKASDYPVAKVYKSDKENCGFRPHTFSWVVYQIWTILKKGKPYELDEIARKVKMLCQDKNVKVKFNAPRVNHSLALLRRRGLVSKVGPDVFKKMVG